MQGWISDTADKGKIALVTYTVETSDVVDGKESLTARVYNTLAIKGLGGFGYKGNGSTPAIPAKPQRNPDFTLVE